MGDQPVVNYRLRNDLRNLFVCLYNPMEAPEEQYTIENLYNFTTDCRSQLERGEPVKRIPFHITAVRSDAQRAIEMMNHSIRELRKEEQQAETVKPGPKPEQRNSWGWGSITPHNTGGKPKGF